MNKREIGSIKEQQCVTFLEESGINVIDKNYRCKLGEVDLIGKEGNTYIFFEVKYRSTADYGYASEAVNITKMKKICRVCDYFRMCNNLNDYTPFRFDVIAFDGDKIDWIRNAFDYIPRGKKTW